MTVKIKELKLKGEVTVKWLAEDNELPLRDISICKKVEEYLNNEAARELNKRHSVAIKAILTKTNTL